MIGRYFHLILFSLLFCVTLFARESVLLFDATVHIHSDGLLTVAEKITVRAEGNQIRRGIVREFPTTYKDSLGNWYVVDFAVQEVMLDDHPVHYEVVARANGKVVNFGDESFLKPGVYTYTITYTTDRQLGFFDGHDELYWNVTGQGWRLPIDAVTATVVLPKPLDLDQIKVAAYTGFQGQRGTDFIKKVTAHDRIVFKTTRPLARFEGLTIVVGFPKGLVDEPAFDQKVIWFLRDNKFYLFILLSIVLILIIMLMAYWDNGKRAGNKPIIPLFFPPEGLNPGAVRYLYKKEYDSVVFASDLVAMAVEGLLTIDYQPVFTAGVYTLKKKDAPQPSSSYTMLFDALFKKGDTVVINGTNRLLLGNVAELISQSYGMQTSELFYFNVVSFVLMVMVGIGGFLAAMSNYAPENIFFWFSLVSLGLVIVLGKHLCNSYSEQGFAVMRAIEGFKLFLSTTETERLKEIGTPPTKTPELYEHYLPYAMALGVEQQWTAQFAGVFKQFEEEHKRPYRPVWYGGGSRFYLDGLSNQISSGVSSAISSSSTRPGGGSGFGGGGGAGGGGGGGGGGGR